jgi:2,3-bisphosphoglycerate-dependent phosphoglycerate mutase
MVILLRVYIVRHGETASNRDGTIQGQLDTALNEEGLRQAEMLARSLQNDPIHVAFTSDLQRAKKVRIIRLNAYTPH